MSYIVTTADINTGARHLLNDFTEEIYTNALILALMNKCSMEIARFIKFPRATWSIPLPAGNATPVTTLDLPPDWLTFDDKDKKGGRAAVLIKPYGGTYAEVQGSWDSHGDLTASAIANDAGAVTCPTRWYPKGATKKSQSLISVTAVNYRCIRGHISATTNQPASGVDQAFHWEVGGAGGSAPVTGTIYYPAQYVRQIGIFPKYTGTPLVADGVIFNYIQIPDDLTSITTSFNQLTDLYKQSYEFFVAAFCFAKSGDSVNANTYWQLFNWSIGNYKFEEINRYSIIDQK